jgi:hypothetical protein
LVIRNKALYLNGKYSTDYWGDGKPGAEGYTAVFRPLVFNYEKFTVVVKLQPEDISAAKKTLLVGGADSRWLALTINDEDRLEVSLNNRKFRHVVENVTITNAQWITVAISFDLESRKVVVYVNGARVEQILLPADFVLDIMNDPKWKEYDEVWTFTNYSYGGTFQGIVAGLLTFDTVLSDDQVHQLFPKN